MNLKNLDRFITALGVAWGAFVVLMAIDAIKHFWKRARDRTAISLNLASLQSREVNASSARYRGEAFDDTQCARAFPLAAYF